jgi:hypothetical protein
VRLRKPAFTSIGKAVDMGLDPTGGKWVASCDRHHALIANNSKRSAESAARNPAEWCDDCREEEERGR